MKVYILNAIWFIPLCVSNISTHPAATSVTESYGASTEGIYVGIANSQPIPPSGEDPPVYYTTVKPLQSYTDESLRLQVNAPNRANDDIGSTQTMLDLTRTENPLQTASRYHADVATKAYSTTSKPRYTVPKPVPPTTVTPDTNVQESYQTNQDALYSARTRSSHPKERTTVKTNYPLTTVTTRNKKDYKAANPVIRRPSAVFSVRAYKDEQLNKAADKEIVNVLNGSYKSIKNI